MNTPNTTSVFRGFRRTMHAVAPELGDRMRAALEDSGVTRQQWRILNALDGAPATAAAIEDAAKRRRRGFGPGVEPGERGFGRRFRPGVGRGFGPGFGPHAGHHRRRRPTVDVLEGLAERGWARRSDAAAPDTEWSLTEAGAEALEHTRAKVEAVKASLREGISDDDWATAMAVLKRVATNAHR